MVIKSFGRTLSSIIAICAMLLGHLLLAGCQSPEAFNAQLAKLDTGAGKTNASRGDIIRPGDALIVTFSDMPPPLPPPSEERVKDDGTLLLIHNQTFEAAGKTRAELEREIRRRYVEDKKFYRNLTVTIKPLGRYYYVDGQVKVPKNYEYPGPTTVLQAIASAGGFTEFAKPTAVRLTHENGEMQIINCKKALTDPRLDLPVYPGDKIFVPRKLW